jgi:putative oxygen-independent coproporphyrinogen III oxidase
MLKSSPRAVYIHIPFCTNKCHYCDFNSYVLQGQPVMDYLEALEREMEAAVKQIPPGIIDTIFVGGGTPTVLTPKQMEYFLRSVRTHFVPDLSSVEFTMEANPGTTDAEKLQVMRDGGVNRISFGVQSFDNHLLHTIGRIHQTDDVFRSLELARQAGFDNLSIDLMFGLPQQTLETLNRSLDEALALKLPHYSIYGLKVEENTLFHTLYQKDKLPLPSEDVELEMYILTMNRLKEAGYNQYEISNFALPGFESRHNTTYWRNEDYYGLGAGAHGYVNRQRHANIKGVEEYIEACQQGLPISEKFEVTPMEAMEDFMMVGLRLLEGVQDDRFKRQFSCHIEDVFKEPVEELLQKKLLDRTDKGYKLSKQGLIYGNDVFAAFLGQGQC